MISWTFSMFLLVFVNLLGSWCFLLALQLDWEGMEHGIWASFIFLCAQHSTYCLAQSRLSMSVSWIRLCLMNNISLLHIAKKTWSIVTLDRRKYLFPPMFLKTGSEIDYKYKNYKVILQYFWFNESKLSFHGKNTLKLFNSHFFCIYSSLMASFYLKE